MPDPTDLSREALAPVHDISGKPSPGIGLCLSGGGYRAMIFHLGSLLRLNEAGLLSRIERFSSVSGGSITAGVLGLKWSRLGFDNGVATRLIDEVVAPVRAMAHQSIDVSSVLMGTLLPGTISDRVAKAYRDHLFGEATLQDLPDDPPRFVINATNVQSGALFRFSKPYARDYKVGEVRSPRIPLARAVAASSAFPPVLSPAFLEFKGGEFTTAGGETLADDAFRRKLVLSDGGVYDNLGLETVWKRYETVLVSDGGMAFSPDASPAEDWALHSKRVLELIDNQVRSLRKRQLIASFEMNLRKGCYWGITTTIGDYGLPDTLPCTPGRVRALGQVPTRLTDMPDDVQEGLINWGYAVCDAALRRYVVTAGTPPPTFPYPRGL